MATSENTPETVNKEALSKRIRELQLEKFTDEKEVSKRLSLFTSTHSSVLSEDDVNFVTLFVESYAPHKKEIADLTTKLNNSTKKNEVLAKLCRTLEEQKKKLLAWKEQMWEHLDSSIHEVKSKIAL